MATVTVFSIIPYQINQLAPIPMGETSTIYLPSAGVIIRDVTNSPTRSLSTGVNVYSAVQLVANGTIYYVSTTAASLASTINA